MKTANPMQEPQTPAHARPRWWRDPLWHFVVLGALLFAIDRFALTHTDDRHTVVVDAAVLAAARQGFIATHNRQPSAEELKARVQPWLDKEIWYREGLALGLDRGDELIRERIVLKTMALVEADIRLPPADDATLQQWFEARRQRYDEPVRYDFEEAPLVSGMDQAAAQELAKRLNAAAEPPAGLRVFKGRTEAMLVQNDGQALATELISATAGEWRVLVSAQGPRVMKLNQITPARPAMFADIRSVLLQDWTDATMADLRSQVLRERSQKYQLNSDAPPP